ncbi:MAG: secretion protein HlyD [Armatimonadota bacterium]|nr:MAG: secretion protein HlyD [Armatimonadota bacterium]
MSRSRCLLVLSAGAAVLAVAAAGCGRKPAPAPQVSGAAVEVTRVRRGDLEAVVNVTGTIRALEDVSLTVKLAGRVARVPYREGDRVARGAVVIQQEQADLQNQVKSAEAALAAARVRLSQAQTQLRVQDVTSDAGVRQAEQAVAIAREQLSIVRTGARPQERRQAEAAVESAKASFENARRNLDRSKLLFEQGAIPRAQLDADERMFEVARASLQSAEQALSLVREGARQEEIRVAENSLKEAEQRLRQARSNAELTAVRKEDVRAAQAGVRQAEAALEMARQALADSSVRSPIAGLVAERHVEPGQMVAPTPGVALIRVYNPATIYCEAVVSETVVDQVAVGQLALIRSDAVPGLEFRGRVQEVYPAADTNNRSFRARISVDAPGTELKPGMFAKVRIVTERRVNQTLIPADCVLKEPGGEYVFVVEKGKVRRPAPPGEGAKPARNGEPAMIEVVADVARKTRIRTGLQGDSMVAVMNGLREGMRVVSSGQNYISDGQEIRVVDERVEAQ